MKSKIAILTGNIFFIVITIVLLIKFRKTEETWRFYASLGGFMMATILMVVSIIAWKTSRHSDQS